MAYLVLVVVAASLFSAAPLRAQADSVQLWTSQLQSGSLREKTIAASKLANIDLAQLPAQTLQTAVDALAQLDAMSPPIAGIQDLGDEDFAGYRLDLVVLAAAAESQAADFALISSVAVSLGVRRRVAQLGDAAIGELASMVAERRDETAALETLGLTWFWADSIGADLTAESRSTVVELLTSGSLSDDFFLRLGTAAALGNAGDPALLPLAREFAQRMETADTRLVGVIQRHAVDPLDARYDDATPLELTEGTARLTAAICLDAGGSLAQVCSQIGPALSAAVQDLAADDVGGAVAALDFVQSAADSAFQSGTLNAAQHTLLNGGAAQVLPRTSMSLAATADTYIRRGTPNRNEGDEQALRILASGSNRALIRVDDASLAAVSGPIAFARIEFDITQNPGSWGPNGRTIGAHRLLIPWTHHGATWNCADDSDPADSTPDCPDAEWAMSTLSPSPYEPVPSGTLLITGDLVGTVSIDVTSDVQAMLSGQVPNHGWLIRKTDEGAEGRIEIASSESGAGPRLVIDVLVDQGGL